MNRVISEDKETQTISFEGAKRNYRKIYALLNKRAGNKLLAQELKVKLVSSISYNRTKSLKELDNKEFLYLKDFLETDSYWKNSQVEMDKLRKRVIASIFGFFKIVNKQVNIGYVKAIAVRASGKGIDDFNKIPRYKLQAIYNMFLNYQKVAKKLSREEAILQLDARILALAGIEVKVKETKGDC